MSYLDIISFHPYGSPEMTSPSPADSNIEEILKLIERYSSKKYPVWNTELYYLHECPKGASSQERSEFEPHHAAWRFLTDLGEGLSQSMPLHASQLTDKDNVPHAAYVVLNALSRHFEGAKAVTKIKNSRTGSICYVYERRGSLIAACWKFTSSDHAQTSIPAAKGLNIFDMYGNKLSIPADDTLNLEASPVYIKPDSHSIKREDFISILRNAFAQSE